MSRPWDAAREVGPELALSLVREQFPALAARRAEPFGSGWDNTAVLIDGALVVRFPRKESAVAFLEAEARALPSLAPRLPLAIPNPEWIGRPTERFPWPFLGYRRLPGRTACSAALTEGGRMAMAEPLGRFLAALHSIPINGLDLPGDTIHRTDFHRRMPLLAERLDALRGFGVIDDPAPWLRLFESRDFPPPAARAVPVHGDLYARHLLVDEANRVTGVIDWGDVHAGDPGIDLSLIFGFLPPPARSGFLRAYGDVDARTMRMARLRAAFHAVSTTWFVRSVNDERLLRAGRTAMRYVLED